MTNTNVEEGPGELDWDWAAMRAEIEAGHVKPEFDITPQVLDALHVITMARREADHPRLVCCSAGPWRQCNH